MQVGRNTISRTSANPARYPNLFATPLKQKSSIFIVPLRKIPVMRRMQVEDPNNQSAMFNITEVGDIEFVNPIVQLSEQIYNSSINFDKEIFQLNKEKFTALAAGIENPEVIVERVLRRNAEKFRQEIFQKILSTELPNNILSILECHNKSEQYKILKGLKLNRDQLILLTFKAWELFGFTYSTYKFEHLPKGIDKKQLPQFAYKEENGDITVVGNTTLTTGQIKQIIEQRKVLIAKFMERGDIWHCFFYTYNSIEGNDLEVFNICIMYRMPGTSHEMRQYQSSKKNIIPSRQYRTLNT